MPRLFGRDVNLSWFLLFLSLGLNVLSLGLFLSLRQALLLTFAEARNAAKSAQTSTIEYSLHIDQTMPLSTTLPIDQNFIIPLRTTLPVSTNITVAPELPLIGRAPINVPIEAQIPVNLDLPVQVQQNVPVQAEIPVDVTVPITIDVAQTPARQALIELDAILKNAEGWLGANSSP
jgi:hypothetical protein